MKKFLMKEFKAFYKADKEVNEEMLRTACKNCGKDFGRHYRMTCPNNKTTFKPDYKKEG